MNSEQVRILNYCLASGLYILIIAQSGRAQERLSLLLVPGLSASFPQGGKAEPLNLSCPVRNSLHQASYLLFKGSLGSIGLAADMKPGAFLQGPNLGVRQVADCRRNHQPCIWFRILVKNGHKRKITENLSWLPSRCLPPFQYRNHRLRHFFKR